jgi:hypothetical protein
MRVTINETEVNIPSSLNEITLIQRIEFQRQHGYLLDEMLKSILEMPDEFERELELVEFQTEKMFRTFSFFTGVAVEVLKESSFKNDIANIYYATLAPLFEEVEITELQREFTWNGDTWSLPPIELKNGDKMKFGELIDSKQIVKDMIEMGASKWEYMLPLCAIYLRKKDEAYEESFLYEGSQRQEEMKGLPMSIALHVSFFLRSTASTWSSTSRYSGRRKLRQAEETRRSTLRNLDGLTS